MGAGIQRWWRDSANFDAACEAWREQEEVQLAQMIVHAPTRQMIGIRRVIAAFVDLWREVLR